MHDAERVTLLEQESRVKSRGGGRRVDCSGAQGVVQPTDTSRGSKGVVVEMAIGNQQASCVCAGEETRPSRDQVRLKVGVMDSRPAQRRGSSRREGAAQPVWMQRAVRDGRAQSKGPGKRKHLHCGGKGAEHAASWWWSNSQPQCSTWLVSARQRRARAPLVFRCPHLQPLANPFASDSRSIPAEQPHQEHASFTTTGHGHLLLV